MEQETREVSVARNGVGYLLNTGAKTLRITPCEVERLMESILRVHPGVPNGVEVAWNNRYAPVIEVSEYFGVVDMEVVPVGYTAVVLIVGVELSHMKTAIHEKPEGAITEAESRWGDVLHVLPEFKKLSSSKQQASKDLLMLQAEQWCLDNGITMDELWAKVNLEQESKDANSDDDVEVTRGEEALGTV